MWSVRPEYAARGNTESSGNILFLFLEDKCSVPIYWKKQLPETKMVTFFWERTVIHTHPGGSLDSV